MALIKCSECNKEISDKATNCPHCGCPVAEMDLPEEEKQEIEVVKEKGSGLFLTISFIISFIIFLLVIGDINFSSNGVRLTSFFHLRYYYSDDVVTLQFLYCLGILFGFSFRLFNKKICNAISNLSYLGSTIAMCGLGVMLHNGGAQLLNEYIVFFVMNIILCLLPNDKKIVTKKEEVYVSEIEEIEHNNELLLEKKKNKKINIFKIIILVLMLIISIFASFSCCNSKNIKESSNSNQSSNSNVTSVNVVTSMDELQEDEVLYIMVINDYINVREKENASSKHVGRVYKDELFKVLSITVGEQYIWYKIEDISGNVGFVASGKNKPYVDSIVKKIDEEVVLNMIVLNNEHVTTKRTPETTNVRNETTKKTTTSKTTVANTQNVVTTTNYTTNVTTTNNIGTTVKTTSSKVAKCKDGWELHNNKCYKWEETKEYIIKTCPAGYTKGTKEDGNPYCYKGEDRESVKPTEGAVRCSDPNGRLYATNGGWACTSGSAYAEKVCPSGYTLHSMKINGTNIYSCLWNNPYKEVYPNVGCSKGEYDRYNVTCKITLTEDPIYV